MDETEVSQDKNVGMIEIFTYEKNSLQRWMEPLKIADNSRSAVGVKGYMTKILKGMYFMMTLKK